MDILGKLFSSAALVRIMRLFLLNPEQGFENNDISARSKVSPQALRTEITLLRNSQFIKKHSFYKEITLPRTRKRARPKILKRRVKGWALNSNFPYLSTLRPLLLSPATINKRNITTRLRNVGKVKLAILGGIFVNGEEGRLDLLVVGDQIRKKRLENVLRAIESEMGKELTYAALDTKEFHYRLSMYDKFVRDILDYPHETLIDKIGL